LQVTVWRSRPFAGMVPAETLGGDERSHNDAYFRSNQVENYCM